MAAASNKSRFVIERLEDRIAPSSMNFCCDDDGSGRSHKHSSKKCKSSKKSHKSSKKCKSSKKSHKGSSKKCKGSSKKHSRKGSSKKCKGSSRKVVKCGKRC